MRPIRVLIIDDSVVIRRLLTDCLASDPEIEVIATASRGSIGLAKIPQLSPDLVTLDVEMPEMSGLEVLAEIRKTHPRLPVIMFSTLTERGATVTIDALSLGASDYVTKPANVGSVGAALERVRSDLIPKIKALCGRALGRRSEPAVALPLVKRAPPRVATGRVEALAIGVSTGGPNALAKLIPSLPRDLGVPILIVQHMPPVFTRILAERLSGLGPFPVREGTPGATVRAGDAWIAPGGHHMVVRRAGNGVAVELSDAPPENSCRPAVDVLFRSAAEAYGGSVLAVVLTGMGQDGWRGSEVIRDGGGQILAQDEETSVVWGMPGFVARAGLAEAVLPLEEMAGEITRRVRGVAFGAARRVGEVR
jgi:two-component system chemotaxis response regulator CheB